VSICLFSRLTITVQLWQVLIGVACDNDGSDVRVDYIAHVAPLQLYQDTTLSYIVLVYQVHSCSAHSTVQCILYMNSIIYLPNKFNFVTVTCTVIITVQYITLNNLSIVTIQNHISGRWAVPWGSIYP